MRAASRVEGQRIRDALADAFESGLLPDQGRLVVAVSGGQDSLALLHATVQAAPAGVEVHALHVDHRMRPSSPDDARYVVRQARAIGAPTVVRRYDVARWAKMSGSNLEAAARSVRYRLLTQIAQALGGCPILTGHTGDDQVETVLLHLLRGAGLDGLTGLHSHQSLPLAALGPPPPRLAHITGEATIVRPLLDVARSETAAYCERHGLRWITDATNADIALTRNRIRHQLVPLLETYNPAVREAIKRLASLARDDALALDEVADCEWQAHARSGKCSVTFDRKGFRDYRRGISGRLLRRAAARLGGQVTLSYEQVDRCLNLAARGDGATRLSANLEWRVNATSVTLISLDDASGAAKRHKGGLE